MFEFIFVIKASKFCNLRCSYCYEFNELHLRDRIANSALRRLFSEIDVIGDYLVNCGLLPTFSFVWHGGEPLILPVLFYREVKRLQKANIRRFRYRNSVQTNLFGSANATIDFLAEEAWEFSLSIDFCDGVRLNSNTAESNRRVIARAELLHSAGHKFGVISVLGAHNAEVLPLAYPWIAKFASSWRILPIFSAITGTVDQTLRLDDDAVTEALMRVFHIRATSSVHVPIEPIDSYTKFSVAKIAAASILAQLPREALENLFLLNVNGDVYLRPFAYDSNFCIGNINDASFVDFFASREYEKSIRTLQARKFMNCRTCDFLGFCDTSPIHQHGSTTEGDGGHLCIVPKLLMQRIEADLLAAGVDRSTISDWGCSI